MRISQMSGQKFGAPYHNGLLLDPTMVLYSRPTIAAVLAAQSLDPDKALPMLKAIQHAHYEQGRRVVEESTLCDIAVECGLDRERVRGGAARRARRRAHRGVAAADGASRCAGLPDVPAADRRGLVSRAARPFRVESAAVSRLARRADQSSRARALSAGRAPHARILRARSRVRADGLDAFERAAQLARSRAARRALGLHALLARRAPQHGRHRERRDVDRDRARRGRHEEDSRRRRRHHAAESLAARRRGAVRHARVAVPGPDRSRARAARRAPISARCARCAAIR